MTNKTTDLHRFGFVTLAGPPNAGKSTLLNKLVGEKVSIISRRPQTTRHRILGIKTRPTDQIVFVDTPGLHTNQPKNLNRVINKTAISSLSEVDLILFMIDFKGWSTSLKQVFKYAKDSQTPIILLINKIDHLKDKSRLLPLIEESQKLFNFVEIVPITALKMNDVDAFLDLISRYLQVGPPGFPDDQITDRSERFMAAEFVREQTFMTLGQELPYAIAVEISKFQTNEKGVLNIDAVIWVEKAGQKSIVIGKDGQQLKSIGTAARRQMEKSFDKKIFLTTWVKVKSGWADQASLLQSLGYTEN